MIRVAGVYEGMRIDPLGGISTEAILLLATESGTCEVQLTEADALKLIKFIQNHSTEELSVGSTIQDEPSGRKTKYRYKVPAGAEDVFGPDPIVTGSPSGFYGEDDDEDQDNE